MWRAVSVANELELELFSAGYQATANFHHTTQSASAHNITHPYTALWTAVASHYERSQQVLKYFSPQANANKVSKLNLTSECN